MTVHWRPRVPIALERASERSAEKGIYHGVGFETLLDQLRVTNMPGGRRLGALCSVKK
jgi:hypothetical protein